MWLGCVLEVFLSRDTQVVKSTLDFSGFDFSKINVSIFIF